MASLPLTHAVQHALERVCAWCHRIERDGRWLPKASESHARVSHGICPDCFDSVLSPR